MSKKNDIETFNKIRDHIRKADVASAIAALSEVDNLCADACVVFGAELNMINQMDMQNVLTKIDKVDLLTNLCKKVYDLARLEFALTRVTNYTQTA